MMNLQQSIAPIKKRTGMGLRTRIALCIVFGIAALFLLTKHWQQVWPFWPYLLLAACPLMHLFMHHGHGNHNKTQADIVQPTESAPNEGHSGPR